MSLFPIIAPVEAAVVAVAYNSEAAGNGSDASSFTFSSQTLGAGKIVVLVGGANESASLSSVTVDGNTASLLADISPGGSKRLSVLQYNGNTSSSGDVVVTYSGTQGRCGIGVYLVTGAADSATDNLEATATSAPSIALDCPANGVIIAAALTENNNSVSWSGVTEDFEVSTEATENRLIGASDAFAAEQVNLTIQATASTNEVNLIGISWGLA